MCVLRSEQPGQLKSGLFCVTAFRTRECLPCAAYAAIPAHVAAGTICFQQTVPAAKSENLILSVRPSTENVGGLFHPIKKEVMHYDKTENRVQHIRIQYDRLGFIPLNELMKEETAEYSSPREPGIRKNGNRNSGRA